MKCRICSQPLTPHGSPHPRDGQLFTCANHRGQGFYASELREQGYDAEVDEAIAEQSARAEASKASWAAQAGYASWNEARAAATLNGRKP